MIELRDYCMARLVEEQLKAGTFELSETEDLPDNATSSMLERQQYRELTERNEARRIKRENEVASKWKQWLLESTPFERPLLHNADLIGALNPSEHVFVYLTFC